MLNFFLLSQSGHHRVIRFPELPILEALPALRAALCIHNAAVLEAPPGAGKSTVVPLALLDEPWVAGRRLIMLEPRRLAARAVAQRMAETLGERVGETVGYRMRLDTKISESTRIEVVTEGVLTRILHSDPTLEGIAAVIFDEFHERSLQADLGLALCLDARSNLGTDLKLLVMSATLDGAAVAHLLGGVPRITSAGRAFPVDINYLEQGFPLLPGDFRSFERATVFAVQRALRECTGDILVFLPGAGEIRRVRDLLLGFKEFNDQRVLLLPLYSELSTEEQDAVFLPSPHATRKVILATNIAETSLTLTGIKSVVDSGLVRRSVFDPVTGMSRLITQRISRASADQRTGRAGRVSAGICYRLWSEGSQESLAAYTPADILEADLASLALDLAFWGLRDADALSWLDAPPEATLTASRELLQRLEALDCEQRITEKGREISYLPIHPRLAHLLIEAKRRGVLRLGAQLVAILTERDFMRAPHGTYRDADILTRIEMFNSRAPALSKRAARQFEHRMNTKGTTNVFKSTYGVITHNSTPLDAAGLLACAYPDRIGRHRSGSKGRFLLANGRGASFMHVDRLARSEFIVAVDLDNTDREARILLAVELDLKNLEAAAGARFQSVNEVIWSSREEAVIARHLKRLDALVIDEKLLKSPSPELTLCAMINGIKEMGLNCLPWNEQCRSWCARVNFALKNNILKLKKCLEFTDTALIDSVGEWLSPWLEGTTRRTQLSKLPLMDALQARLGYENVRYLDELVPTHIILPTGSKIQIDYLDDLAPCASMRMQEVFGLEVTPSIGGTIPITFKLLSPAQRPLQATADLASFWRNAYTQVRKDMRGRYPRHYWPEDPLQAKPTRGIRQRS